VESHKLSEEYHCVHMNFERHGATTERCYEERLVLYRLSYNYRSNIDLILLYSAIAGEGCDADPALPMLDFHEP
jgi:hypothetical protein